MLGPKARKSLLKVRRISSRLLIAEFDGSPKTSVIAVYSPTNCADEDTVKEFYDSLRNTISDVPLVMIIFLLSLVTLTQDLVLNKFDS